MWRFLKRGVHAATLDAVPPPLLFAPRTSPDCLAGRCVGFERATGTTTQRPQARGVPAAARASAGGQEEPAGRVIDHGPFTGAARMILIGGRAS